MTYSVLSAAIFSSRRGISTGLVSKSSQPAAIALSRSALIASPILRGSTLIAMMQAANLREGNNVIACRSLASRGKVRQGHQGTCQQPEIVVDKPSVLRHGNRGAMARSIAPVPQARSTIPIGDGRQRKRRPHRARLKLRGLRPPWFGCLAELVARAAPRISYLAEPLRGAAGRNVLAAARSSPRCLLAHRFSLLAQNASPFNSAILLYRIRGALVQGQIRAGHIFWK